MEAATAMMAFLAPRRALRRKNCAGREEFLVRTAAQAAVTRVVLSHGAPGRTRVERRFPALSSWRGHSPAQETRWAAVGKRVMSMPISATRTWATVSLTPGIVIRRPDCCRTGAEGV